MAEVVIVMQVSVILRRKGAEVATVPPGATLVSAAERMSRDNIGALVVSWDGRVIEGIVSERDIVRQVASHGAACLERPVSDVADPDVVTCGEDTKVDDLMATMTEQRIRHVPVVRDGALAGIVSIGDVVKLRLDELEVQAQALTDYVTGSRP
jgi:CBS domain-containing protein